MSYNIKITYFGVLRSISSWSKVAREILKCLVKKGVDVSIYEIKGFLYDKYFNLEELEKYCCKKINDIIFTFEHPSKYPILPHDKFKIAFLVYEFTTLPKIWVENINKYINLVLVPSNFTYEVFIKSGVDKRKLKILRYGYNPSYYYPKEKTKKIRNFITVASPHKREALDILLKGFGEAFKDIDDVRLTIKLSYLPFKKTKSFEIPNFINLINYYRKTLGQKINIITDKLNEYEMANLYRSSDIYISLSKSESFGLPFIEAIACGRGCISLKYGGQTDFLTDENTIFVSHKIVQTNGEEYEKTQEKQYIAQADLNDYIEKLMFIYKNGFDPTINPSEIKKYEWDNITEEFIDIIRSIY